MSTETVTSPAPSDMGPGFRFHPTDQELVCYYLKRKVLRKRFYPDAISEIEIYKCEPWDLPAQSRLKNGDLEWYFFSLLDKKHGSGSRTNRTTRRGYWKTTGKDRPVQQNARTVGMKRTLVFYIGRTPIGARTNWVMHEYRLEDIDLVAAGVLHKDAYVVCKLFQKSGSGPKNGEQYGAPFIEEEWDEDALLRKKENVNKDPFYAGEQNYVQPIDHEQNTYTGVMVGNDAPVMRFNGPDSCNSAVDPVGFLEGAHAQSFLAGAAEDPNSMKLYDNQERFDNVALSTTENTILPQEYGDQDFFVSMDGPIYSPQIYPSHLEFINGHFIQLSDIDNPDHDAFIAHNQPTINNGSSPEITDFSNPANADSSGLERVDEYLMYFAVTDNNLHYEALGSYEQEELTLNQSNHAVEAEEGTVESFPPVQQASEVPDMEAALPWQKPAPSGGSEGENDNFKATNVATESDAKTEGSWRTAFTKSFSGLLDSIPSPPAFAAEYSLNGSAKSNIQNLANPSSSIQVNPETFVSKLAVTDSKKHHWTVQKKGDAGFLLSYGTRSGDVMVASQNLFGNSVCLEPLAELPCKAKSAMVRNGLRLCFWVLILAASFKIGSYFCAR